MRPRYSSNSGIFARRGDPWVSDKEGVRDFGRDPETENPDLDFDRRFHHSRNAKGKPKTVEPRKEYRDPLPPKLENTPTRRKAGLMLIANQRIREGKKP